MLMSIMSSFWIWVAQVKTIVSREASHMSPEDYSIALVFCICVGFVLLRSKH